MNLVQGKTPEQLLETAMNVARNNGIEQTQAQDFLKSLGLM